MFEVFLVSGSSPAISDLSLLSFVEVYVTTLSKAVSVECC